MLSDSALLSFIVYIVMFRVLFVSCCLIALYYPLICFILLRLVYVLFHVVS